MRLVVAALAALVLAACGGGGSVVADATSSSAPATPSPTPATSLASADPIPADSAPLMNVTLTHPIVVYGDSMAVRLAAALGRAVVSGVESHALGGSKSATAVQYAATFPPGDQTTVIWTGHNDFIDPATVLVNIGKIVSRIGHTRYVIVTMAFEDLPGERIGGADRVLKEQANAAILAAYPGHVVNATRLLSAWGNPSNAQDAADLANGVTPSSLRTDLIHLSPTTSDLLARQMLTLLSGAGW